MDLRRSLFAFYRAAQTRIAPSLRYSQAIYEDVLREHVPGKALWLDLGCGRQLLPPWRQEAEHSLVRSAGLLVGLDYDLASLKANETMRHRVRGDITRLPFAADIFQLVTSNMVFEHLRDPAEQLREIHRVLQPGGTLVFHTPNAHGYGVVLGRCVPDFLKKPLIAMLQDRGEADIFPTYYRINTSKSIEEAAHQVGFEVRTLRLIVSSALFTMIPPLAVVELLLIRLLMSRLGRPWRTNIIAVLRKPGVGDPAERSDPRP